MKQLKTALIILAISVALFIPAAEIALRTTCDYCTWTETSGKGFVSPYDVAEPSWYHVREPNSVTTLQFPEFEYEIRTNSLGFRDIEHPLEKPEDEVRILAIGDSFTEGWGARFEYTWLNVLADSLAERYPDTRFRTMCAGSSGSDLFFGYKNLVDRLLVYEPDWVLLVINDSDILDVLTRGGMERFQPDGTTSAIADAPPIPFGYEHSQLARFILFEGLNYTHSYLRRPERNRRAQLALGKLEELLLEYRAVLEPRGIKLSLVLQPYTKEIQRQEYQRLGRLGLFAEQHGIHVIDTSPFLLDKLNAHNGDLAELYWPIDMHFNEQGYRYFAEAVEEGMDPGISSLVGCPSDSCIDSQR